MFVDGCVIISLCIAGVVGWVRGTAMGLIGVLLVGFCLALGRWLGPEIGIFYHGKTESSPAEAVGLGFLLTFGIFFAVGSFAAHKLTTEMRDVETERPLVDRLAGAALGAARGAVIAYAIAVGFQTRARPGTGLFAPEASRTGLWVAEHSVLASPVQQVTDMFALEREVREGEDERALPYERPREEAP